MTNHTPSTSSPSLRPFFTVWAGQACSLLGSQLVQFALIWWLTTTTGSATVLAYASLVGLLPQVLIGPFAGALVDRWSRKRVMIAADGAIALATALLAVLYALGAARVGHVYALLFVRALGAAFHKPAMIASTTLMAPRDYLPRVAGLNHTLEGVAGIAIPPLGALTLAVLPMQAILAIDVLTALPAIVTLLVVAIPQPPRAASAGARPSVWGEMRAGLSYVWGWKALLAFAAVGTVINLMGRGAGALMPILVSKQLGGGAMQLGLIHSAAGVGAIMGGVTLGIGGGYKRRLAASFAALALDGALLILTALAPRGAFIYVAGLMLFSGLLETLAIGIHGAIFQMVVTPEMQGRVFGLLMTVAQISAPLGLAVAGPVADALGAGFWWILAGALISAVGVGSLFIPAVMRIEQPRAGCTS